MLPTVETGMGATGIALADPICQCEALGNLLWRMPLSVVALPEGALQLAKLNESRGCIMLQPQVGQQRLCYADGISASHIPLMPPSGAFSFRGRVEVHVATKGLVEEIDDFRIHLHEGEPGDETGDRRTISASAVATQNIDRPIAVHGPGEVAEQADIHVTSIPCQQDSGPRPGEQGRIPAGLWARKEVWR